MTLSIKIIYKFIRVHVVSITNILVFPDNAKYTLTFKSLGSVRYVLQKLIVLFIKDAFN